jgi:spore coat protein U-like protein
MKFSKIALSSLAVAGSFLLTQPVSAVDLGVSATVTSDCSITTAPVAFGNYAPATTNLATPLVGTGTVTVQCTSGGLVEVKLDQGATPAGGSTDIVPARQMISGANLLPYFLYSDSGRTAPWGSDDSSDVNHTGTGTSTALTVFGRIPAGQNVPAGAYADTVIATATF